ncbi:ABC transporter ATP-binding protein [Staphylococcus felis]|uniref:ABC transporter ATP-binding protein n=1 Tax=Staphylococcus felis TaxID=46127 RepID=UPI00396746F2
MIAKVTHLHKTLNGREIIKDISFTLEKGTIHAILGPNGVGKTTTIRLLTGLLKPSEGAIQVFDMETTDPHFDRIRQYIGVQNDGNLYESLTIRENLEIWAQFYNMTKIDSENRMNELLAHFNLLDRKESKVGSLSKGMKQKVAIIRALLHHPQLLILDEPTSGLDPSASEDLIAILQHFVKHEGMTIFMCTHQLQGLEQIADHLLIMYDGRFIASGQASGLLREEWPETSFDIRTVDAHATLKVMKEKLAIDAQLHSEDGQAVRVTVPEREMISRVIEALVHHHIDIITVTEVKHTIKELYFKKIGEVQNAKA